MTSRPIPCEETRGLLDERLDGPLDGASEEALRVHLAACAACREEAAALASVDAVLLGMEAPDPGPAFSDRVIAALDRAPGGPSGPPIPPVPPRVRLLRFLVGATGTAAFVALAMALLPVEATASTVGGLVPVIPAPPLPEVLAGFSGFAGSLPAWAAAAGALLAAAGAALPVAALRRGDRRR